MAAAGGTAQADFIETYLDAPEGTEVEFLVGWKEGKGPAVLIVCLDGLNTVFTVDEALGLAEFAETAMRKSPDDPDAKALPLLIVALRRFAEEVQKQ